MLGWTQQKPSQTHRQGGFRWLGGLSQNHWGGAAGGSGIRVRNLVLETMIPMITTIISKHVVSFTGLNPHELCGFIMVFEGLNIDTCMWMYLIVGLWTRELYMYTTGVIGDYEPTQSKESYEPMAHVVPNSSWLITPISRVHGCGRYIYGILGAINQLLAGRHLIILLVDDHPWTGNPVLGFEHCSFKSGETLVWYIGDSSTFCLLVKFGEWTVRGMWPVASCCMILPCG